MTHKIRVYTARVETRHGTQSTSLIDDPVSPRSHDDIIDELMWKLNYTENEDDDDCCNQSGECDGVDAYFDYDGYMDYEIPESIVKRIMEVNRNDN